MSWFSETVPPSLSSALTHPSTQLAQVTQQLETEALRGVLWMHVAVCLVLAAGGAPASQLYIAIAVGLTNFIRHLHPPWRKSWWNAVIVLAAVLLHSIKSGGAFSYILWIIPSLPAGLCLQQVDFRPMHLVLYCIGTELLIYLLPWMKTSASYSSIVAARTTTDITVYALATAIVMQQFYYVVSRFYRAKSSTYRRMSATFEWHRAVTLPVRDLIYCLLRRQSLSKAAAGRLVDPLDLLLESFRERDARNEREAFLPEAVRYRTLRILLLFTVCMTGAATMEAGSPFVEVCITILQLVLAVASWYTDRHLGLIIFCFQALGTSFCVRDAIVRSGGFYAASMNCTLWTPFAFFTLASRSDEVAMIAVGTFNVVVQVGVLGADAMGLVQVAVPRADEDASLIVFALCRVVNATFMYAVVAVLRARVYQCLFLQYRTSEDITAHASNTIDALMEGLQRDDHDLHDVASVRSLQILHDSLAAGLQPSSSRLTRFVAMRNADLYMPHNHLSDVGMSFMLRELCMTLACALGPRILLGLPMRGTRSRRCLAWCRADRVTIARLLLDAVLNIVAHGGGSSFPAEIRVRCALRGVGDQLSDPVDWTEGAHTSDDDSDDPASVHEASHDGGGGDERRVGSSSAWAGVDQAELQLHIVAIGELAADVDTYSVHGSSVDTLEAIARTFGGSIDLEHRRGVIRFPAQRPESTFERVRTLRASGSSASRAPPNKLSSPRHRTAGGSILVAVGDSAIRALINKQLGSMGFPVTNARSAVAARNLFQSKYRSLRAVLMDAHMTEKSLWNPTAIAAFLKRRDASSVGIIWLGDRSSRIDTSDADAIVRKPVSWPALAAILDALPPVPSNVLPSHGRSSSGSSSSLSTSPGG